MASTKSDKNEQDEDSSEWNGADMEVREGSECPQRDKKGNAQSEKMERTQWKQVLDYIWNSVKRLALVVATAFLSLEENKDVQPEKEMERTQWKQVLQYIWNSVKRLALVVATAILSPEENKDVQPEKERKTEKKLRDREKVKKGLGRSALFGGIVCLVAIAVIYISPPERVTKGGFDFAEDFGNGVDQLKSSFTNQTERFWKILKNRGSAHLKDNNPSQPLVLLLAAPPLAHAWVDCLATKLAEMLALKQKNNLARIDGADKKGYPGDEIKEEMDVYLKEKFEDDHRVAVIHHLELLPPPSALLFYSYCDDQNAPYKHVAIIFTVHLPFEPSKSLSSHEAEGSVNKYLLKEGLLSDDRDKVAALLSRIADTVAVMKGESGDSLKDYCS